MVTELSPADADTPTGVCGHSAIPAAGVCVAESEGEALGAGSTLPVLADTVTDTVGSGVAVGVPDPVDVAVALEDEVALDDGVALEDEVAVEEAVTVGVAAVGVDNAHVGGSAPGCACAPITGSRARTTAPTAATAPAATTARGRREPVGVGRGPELRRMMTSPIRA